MRTKKDEVCKIQSETPVCTNANVDNISYFLAYELPKCQIYDDQKEPIKFTLNAISKGTIIGNGSFGYIFRIINNEKKYIIKITLGNKDNNSDKEYKILTTLNDKFNTKNIFIKLYGYYKELGNDSYELFGNTECKGQIKQFITCRGIVNKRKTDYNSYGIMEAAEGSLMDYLKKGINKNIVNIVNIVNNFEPFLKNFCHAFKINDIIFVHNDIKPENIVYFSDGQLKLIDFDAAKLPKTQNNGIFPTFFCRTSTVTWLYIEALYMTNVIRNISSHISSPFYDIFCLCVSFLEIMLDIDWATISSPPMFTFSNMESYIKKHMRGNLKSDTYYILAQKFINIIVFIRDMYGLIKRAFIDKKFKKINKQDTELTTILRKMLNLGSHGINIGIDYEYRIDNMGANYNFSQGDYINYCSIIDSLLDGAVTKHERHERHERTK